VARGFLGVSVDPIMGEMAETLGLKKDSKGVVLNNVTVDGPAEKAGLKRGDAILSINDHSVTSRQDIRLLVSQIPPDTEVTVKSYREGREKIVKVKLGKLTDDGESQTEILPGIQVARLSDEIRRRLNTESRIDGLIVTSVDPESPYAERFVTDMVILEINRSPVSDLETAKLLLQPGRNLLLVYVGHAYRYIAVSIKKQ